MVFERFFAENFISRGREFRQLVENPHQRLLLRRIKFAALVQLQAAGQQRLVRRRFCDFVTLDAPQGAGIFRRRVGERRIRRVHRHFDFAVDETQFDLQRAVIFPQIQMPAGHFPRGLQREIFRQRQLDLMFEMRREALQKGADLRLRNLQCITLAGERQ
ncbi:MAG: hypothetical protein ALAOOOJD_01690 [bacterium]|nr:hypothetical protein [bacterium]